MEVNGKEVSTSTATNRAYKPHLDTLLGIPKNVKKEKLKDTVLYFDEHLTKAAAKQKNDGGAFAEKHTAFTKEGGRFIRTPLFLDFFNCHRYFLPDTTLRITFVRNDENFCLIKPNSETKSYKLYVKDMVLVAKRIEANPRIWNDHEKFYDQGMSAYLPVTHTTLQNKLVPSGTSSILLENVVLGNLVPFKIFMVMVDHDSYSGAKNKNPFHYKHFNLKELEFHVNGKSYPTSRYNFEWNNGNVLTPYFDLMKAIGAGGDHVSPNITLEAFKDHASIFVFDNSPDDCCSVHTHIPMSGQVHVDLKFSSELTEPVSVIFYAFYKKLLKFSRESKDFPPTVDFVDHI